jgi:hypothetical protein
MRSKIGIHIHEIEGHRYNEFLSFMAEAKPSHILTLVAKKDWLTQALSVSPLTKIIQRAYCDKQPLTDPVAEAYDLARNLASSSIYDIIADNGGFWVGYNEIAGFSHDQRKRYNEFDYMMAELAHGYGVKYLCGSWSVGRLHVDLAADDPLYEWRDMYPSMRISDGIAAHIYNYPTAFDERDHTVEIIDGEEVDVWWRIGRPELVRRLLPDDLKDLPWYLTEGILDSGAAHWPVHAQGGWASVMAPEEHLDDIRQVDEFYANKDYAKCVLLFGWGTVDPTWDSFDPSKPPQMFNLLQKYLQDKNCQIDIDDPDFRSWLSEEAQKHVIPMTYGTAFRQQAQSLGLTEAMSDEFYPAPGVVAQVYHNGIDRDQYILYTIVGDWDNIRCIVRKN